MQYPPKVIGVHSRLRIEPIERGLLRVHATTRDRQLHPETQPIRRRQQHLRVIGLQHSKITVPPIKEEIHPNVENYNLAHQQHSIPRTRNGTETMHCLGLQVWGCYGG
jgi:hypothetical protein